MANGIIFQITKRQIQYVASARCFNPLRRGVTFHRCASSLQVTEDRPLPNLLLRKVNRKNEISKVRPLVLLFDWLYAKPDAIKKYCQLYHEKGLDVLIVRGEVKHFLWPPKGFKMVTDVLNYLYNERDDKESLLVHAFSVGAYNYTVMMMAAAEMKEHQTFKKRVIGQIFDSIVIGTYENMSEGIATNLPRSKIVRSLTLSSLDSYYNLTRKHTKDRYDELVHFFIHCPIQVPSLVFYSLNDPMCDVTAMENMLNVWKKDFPDFSVDVQNWEKSVHAAHLRFHEEEYKEIWMAYMMKLGL